MSAGNIDLRIDELVLDALPFDQRQRVSAAIEGELTRLLAESAGAEDAWSTDRNLPVHEVEVSPQWSAEAIGHHVAQSAYQRIAAAGPTNNPGIS